MTEPKGFPNFATSIQQAVAIFAEQGERYSADHLKAARKAGVRAFRSSRIYFEQTLFDWLAANVEDALPDAPEDEDTLEPKETLERRKLREQFLAARHRRLVEEGRYLARAEVIERDIIAVAQFRASLNGLRSDAPQWSGLPPHEILRRASDKIDGALRELEAGFRKLAHG